MYLLHYALIRSDEPELAKTIKCSARGTPRGDRRMSEITWLRLPLILARVDRWALPLKCPVCAGRYRLLPMSWHCLFVNDFARHDELLSSLHWTKPPVPISGTPGKNPRQWQVFTLEIQVYPPLPQNPLSLLLDSRLTPHVVTAVTRVSRRNS